MRQTGCEVTQVLTEENCMAILRHTCNLQSGQSHYPQKVAYRLVASYDTHNRGGTILKTEPHGLSHRLPAS